MNKPGDSAEASAYSSPVPSSLSCAVPKKDKSGIRAMVIQVLYDNLRENESYSERLLYNE